MSLTTVQSLFSYAIASLGQAFAPACEVQNASDFIVTYTAPVTFLDTVLTLNVDYFVTGAATNGIILAPTITLEPTGIHYAVAGTLTIQRKNPYTQPTTYVDGVKYMAAVPNNSLNWLAYSIQALNDVASRCLQVPATGPVMAPMTRTARASKVVGFDSNGALTFYAFVGGSVAPQSVAGTANQVLVNGGTAPATGAITLTLPQSIGTGSTVQFQKLGIGTAVGANNDVLIQHSAAAITASSSVEVTGSLTAPAATDLHPNAFRDTTSYVSSVAADAYASYDSQTVMGGTLAYNHFYGYQVRHGYAGSNTLGVMAGFATLNMGVSTGTVTKLRGFYVSDAMISGGTVGAWDGIYIDQLSATSGATVITAINVAGNNTVSMAGGQLWISALLAPIVTTSRLDVTFDQGTQQGLAIKNKNATNTGTYVNFYNSSTVVQGSISQTNSTTTAFNTASDARLKENIRDFTDSGRFIDGLRPRLYDWRSGEKDAIGFVAQEEAAVDPVLARIGAVTVGDDDAGADPAHLEKQWQRSDQALVPIVVAELKSIRGRLAAAGIA